MIKELNIKIPGKVVLNGSYIVLEGEYASCITLNRYLNANIKIKNSETFGLSLNIKDREDYNYDTNNNYLNKIIKTSLEYLKINQKFFIEITGYFDKDFFLSDNIKTGIGSSSCIFICIIYSLLQTSDNIYNQEDLIRIMYDINNIISPKSSGCDIITSLCGPINYSRSSIKKLHIPCKYIILGTFGKSTCTRKMLDLIKESDWNKLKKINYEIINSTINNSKINFDNSNNSKNNYDNNNYEIINGKINNISKSNKSTINDNNIKDTKKLYKDYLIEIRNINKLIVPIRQYEILINTFMYNIYGCGISGAGGEDAVWCITDNKEDIQKYWESVFDYVVICELVNHGLLIL